MWRFHLFADLSRSFTESFNSKKSWVTEALLPRSACIVRPWRWSHVEDAKEYRFVTKHEELTNSFVSFWRKFMKCWWTVRHFFDGNYLRAKTWKEKINRNVEKILTEKTLQKIKVIAWKSIRRWNIMKFYRNFFLTIPVLLEFC